MKAEPIRMHYRRPEQLGAWTEIGIVEEFSVVLTNGMKVDAVAFEGVLKLHITDTPKDGKGTIAVEGFSAHRKAEFTIQ